MATEKLTEFLAGNYHLEQMPHIIQALHVTIATIKTVNDSVGSLKNWYQEIYDPATENKFRLELTDALLFEKGWTFLDVEQNLDAPWIMVDRDEKGWLATSRPLPFGEDDSIVKYREAHGLEVNYKTGEVTFLGV